MPLQMIAVHGMTQLAKPRDAAAAGMHAASAVHVLLLPCYAFSLGLAVPTGPSDIEVLVMGCAQGLVRMASGRFFS